MAAAVPAEHELLEVDVDVLLPQPVIDAHRPPLEVREDAVNVLQDMVRLDVCRQYVFVMQAVGNPAISRISVGHDDRAFIGLRSTNGCRSSRPYPLISSRRIRPILPLSRHSTAPR